MSNEAIFTLLVILAVASITDLWSHKIPNLITYPAILGGIIYHASLRGYEGLFFSLGGVGVGFALLMVMYFGGGTGAGDVKLMGAVGGILGPKGVWIAFLYSSLIGLVHAFILLSWEGYLMSWFKRYATILKTFLFTQQLNYLPPKGKERELKISYGLSIALGTGLYLFLGNCKG